jgi:3',5'-cyclic-AMP phosphodiesterase
MRMKDITAVLMVLICQALIIGCADVNEYSPNQAFDNDTPQNINAKNIQRLLEKSNNDTLSIVFIGDSQRFYDEVDLFVETVNRQRGIDVVFVAGDITDFGLLQEFEWVVRSLDKLKVPYVSVIGNHDVVANGEDVFARMFGLLNFSFTYDSTKFIFHNTNSREYRGDIVPDLDWLEKELAAEPGVKNYIGVSHVPPFHADFNRKLESSYHQLLMNTPNFLVSLHGHVHKHTDGYPYEDGIRYITGHYFKEREFIRLDIHNGRITKTIIKY